MAKSKKLLTSVIALGTAAAIGLGGTFAWQSINQSAINEASDINNPGGRLHNDLYYVDSMKTDSNVYVENFDTDDIYARVRLEEYMEVVLNYGTPAQKVVNITGKKLDKTTGEALEDQNVITEKDKYDYEYTVHKFGGDNATDDYFTWNAGTDESEAVYMPTFNKDKDSLRADLHGLYADRVGGISNRGTEQYTEEPWEEGATKDGYEIWDADSNSVDELKDLSWDALENLIEVGDKARVDETVLKAVKFTEATHTAKAVGDTKGLISMDEWMDLLDGDGVLDEDGKLTDAGKTAMYGYWVYDTDGWVYWSAPIAGGETTGLLLDGFDLNEVMDNTWYYAINVVGQFVTANDVGKANNTGFYATLDTPATIDEDGDDEVTAAKPVSDDAEKLLELIGVTIPADTTSGDDDDDDWDDDDLDDDTTYDMVSIRIEDASENEINAGYTASGTVATKIALYDEFYHEWFEAPGEVTWKDGDGNDVSDPVEWYNDLNDSDTQTFTLYTLKCLVDGEEKGTVDFKVYDGTRHKYVRNVGNEKAEYSVFRHLGEPEGVCVLNESKDGWLYLGEGNATLVDNTGWVKERIGSATVCGAEDAATDWSQLVTMRNITSDEYNKLCDVTNGDDDIMHWSTIYSDSDDIFRGTESIRVMYGNFAARNADFCEVTDSSQNGGLRPVFVATNSNTDCASLNAGDIVVMGTLYVGNTPVKVPTNPVRDGDITNYDKDKTGVTDKITLGTALEDSDYQMKAVYVGEGVFVCDRVMLNCISWNQINAALTAD